MAGPKGSRYYDIFLRYRIWLESVQDRQVISTEAFDLLHQVRLKGSLMSAAREMHVSYRKAWGMVRDAEENLGFTLLEKQRGGIQGGRSVLTEEGEMLINAYLELKAEFDAATKQITRKFFHRLNEEDS